MAHYMMDCFSDTGGNRNVSPDDSRRIVASTDPEAISEAQGVASWLRPTRFHVRAVARRGDRVIYRSDQEGS